MSNNNRIKCPNCGTSIDVQDVLTHQLEDEIQKKYAGQLEQEKNRFAAQENKLRLEQEAFEQKKKQENELFQEKLNEKLKQERRELEEKLKKRLAEEQQEQFESLQRELNEKSAQVKELNKAKAEIEQLKRSGAEAREAAEAEAQKKFSEMIALERERIKKLEEDKNELKVKELQKQLEDQKKLTEEMKRKQDQGSMQLQGEVLELAIEEWLMATFPLDEINEIKKGARGGDCIQIVNTYSRKNCGSIYYESKRTKDFQSGWIEKFKADMRDKNSTIGVLVTEAMPSDMPRMGLKDGIWICNYDEFKGLSSVLRETVIRLSEVADAQENKGDKMHMLYDYLTGNTFRMQVEAIVEGFSSMKNALESEKRSMHRIWKEREKQIEKVIYNTIDMYGSVKGIAGSAVKDVPALELGAIVDADKNEDNDE